MSTGVFRVSALVGALASPAIASAATREPVEVAPADDWALGRPAYELRVGLLAGAPIGVAAALQLGPRLALNADVGPSPSDRVRGIAAVDLAYWMPEVFGPIGEDGFMVPWFGLGARVAIGRDDEPDRFGFRAPFGISYVGRERAIEIFVAVSPGLAVVPGRWATLDGGLGIRVGL